MNQKKYWLRGGMILGVPSLTLMVLSIVTANPNSALVFSLGIFQSPLSWLLYPILPYTMSGNIFLLVITGFVGWFIVGAIIGWLYGKIKNRNKIVQ